MSFMAQDYLMGLTSILIYLTHATVSYRDTPWLPHWLGRGCKPEDFSVHLRVAICNLFYGSLFFWLGWIRVPDAHWPLLAGSAIGGILPLAYGFVRGRLALRKLIFYKNIQRLYQGA